MTLTLSSVTPAGTSNSPSPGVLKVTSPAIAGPVAPSISPKLTKAVEGMLQEFDCFSWQAPIRHEVRGRSRALAGGVLPRRIVKVACQLMFVLSRPRTFLDVLGRVGRFPPQRMRSASTAKRRNLELLVDGSDRQARDKYRDEADEFEDADDAWFEWATTDKK